MNGFYIRWIGLVESPPRSKQVKHNKSEMFIVQWNQSDEKTNIYFIAAFKNTEIRTRIKLTLMILRSRIIDRVTTLLWFGQRTQPK